MKLVRLFFLAKLASLLLVAAATAETAYITDKISVGLHAEKSLDSPIVTILPSGTEVEIAKSEEDLSYVQDPEGNSGWIDNSYLVQHGPEERDNGKLQELNAALEIQLADAHKKISELEVSVNNGVTEGSIEAETYNELKQEYSILQQQFNSERLNSGELQVQLTELKKRIGQDNDNASMYEEIENLQEDKKNLEISLAIALDRNESMDMSPDNSTQRLAINSWKHQLVYFSIALIIGLCLGIYLMDYRNRRKHGGFRI